MIVCTDSQFYTNAGHFLTIGGFRTSVQNVGLSEGMTCMEMERVQV